MNDKCIVELKRYNNVKVIVKMRLQLVVRVNYEKINFLAVQNNMMKQFQ